MAFKNIDQLIEDFFTGFNPKQRKVLTERFGLRSGHRSTLQEIGDDLGITRERVRQIEEDGLRKVAPRVKDKAANVLEFTKTYLANSLGVRRDDYLVGDITNHVFAHSSAKNIHDKLRFLFLAAGEPFYYKEDDEFRGFWYLNDATKKNFFDFVKDTVNFFENKGREKLINEKDYLAEAPVAASDFLSIPKCFGVNVFGDVGLRDWPEIDPKTIRDKIYLVLKKEKTPLHFGNIAKAVTRLGLQKKNAHIQTVHNELIKDNRFVLVGRGIYALREHGFEPGTVREVIARFLKDRGPLHPEEILKLVQNQRLLKENTVLLSLQNRRYFGRLDDGRYMHKEA
ncbi:MAG: sigma factor-like helix-turn-helix DNA-binding protein [Patescibacteria group bacterium]